MADFHRLSAAQLRINEALPWDVFDVSGMLLLRKGYVIQKNEQIERLLERGMFVPTEVYKAYLGAEASTPRQVYDPLSIWQSVQVGVAGLMKEPPKDGTFTAALQAHARQVMELCERSPDLAIAAILLKEYKRYPVAHGLHVAVLCELVARRGDFDEASRMSLCCAALTQNIAIVELQQILTHQKTPLTPEQRAAVDAHPEQGCRILMSVGVTDQEWLRAILEHHESEDGTGYPRKITSPSMLASLIHTCDVYAAMLSQRAYRKALLGADAAKQMYVGMGQGKENPFPGLLIKEVGMYPPGSVVKLANGEVGVVFKRGAQANTPVVATLINTKGLAQMDPVKRDTSQDAFKVVTIMPPSTMLNVNFEQIWKPRS
jgi:HD-GYP domain-containing protein (c-di-GMP phosphodiesterase class II)